MTQNLDEKKTTSRLIIFVVIALSAFGSGVFFGLFFPKSENTPPEETDTIDSKPLITEEKEEEETPDQDQKESVKQYKKMLEKSIQSELKEDLLQPRKSYGIVLASFKNRDKANERAIDLHTQYENWNITTQKIDHFYKVVVGTFTTREEAQKFLNNMPKRAEFLQAKIKEFVVP